MSLSIPPIVERVELSVYRKACLMSCHFKIPDGPYNFGVTHVPLVIILVNSEDAEMQLLALFVKSLEV